MHRYCFVCLLLSLLAACGQAREAATPGSAMPATVMAPLDELTALCGEAGGTPHAENAVRRADLNADGADDYILFVGWIWCENAISIYGDRQKGLVVFANDGRGGAIEAFQNIVFDAEIESADGTPQLWLTTMAEQCGRPSAATFAEESFCRRPIVAVAPDRFEYAPLSTVRMIE